MFTELFKSSVRIRELLSSRAGPLLEGFSHELCQAGYAEKTAREHIRSAEHFIYWIYRKGFTVATLNDSFIDGFGRHLYRCRCPRYRHTPRINLQNGARKFLRYLRAAGAVASPASEQMTDEPVLLTEFHQMTRSGFEYILRKHVRSAIEVCPSLLSKRVSPHVLRHSCALTILQATKDLRKVSLWLGHSNMQTTEMYIRADPAVKLETLESVVPPKLRTGRFKATDKLLASLRAGSFMRSQKVLI